MLTIKQTDELEQKIIDYMGESRALDAITRALNYDTKASVYEFIARVYEIPTDEDNEEGDDF